MLTSEMATVIICSSAILNQPVIEDNGIEDVTTLNKNQLSFFFVMSNVSIHPVRDTLITMGQTSEP